MMPSRATVLRIATAILLGASALPAAAAAPCIDYSLSPRLVGVVDTPDSAKDVAASGTWAYVADNSDALQVVDISDPAAATITRTVLLNSVGLTLAVEGTYAYVGIAGGLEVLDVSHPDEPTPRGTVATTGTPIDVAVSGAVAYVAIGNGGYDVIDCSSPDSPALVTTVSDRPASGIAVDGTRLATTYAYHVHFYDRSAPLAPSFLGEAEIVPDTSNGESRSFSSPVVVGDVVLLVDDFQFCDPAACDPFFAGWMAAWDFTVPSSPVEISATPVDESGVVLVKNGNLAYLNSNDSGLWILDVSNLAAPTVLYRVRAYGTDGGACVATTAGGPVFLSCKAGVGVRLVDVAHPDQPSWVGNATAHTTSYDVAFIDPWAYMLDYYNRSGGLACTYSEGNLRSFDVTDPDDPIQIDTQGAGATSTWGDQICASGDKLLLRVPNYQLYRSTVNLTDGIPSPPVFVTSVPGYYWDMKADGGYVLLAQHTGGLTVLDPTPSGDPTVVTNVPTYYVDDIGVDGAVGVTHYNATLRTVDLTDVTSPVFVGSTTTAANNATWVAVKDHLVALGFGGAGFQLVDVSDLANPVAYPNFTPGFDYVNNGTIQDGILYLSLQKGGVLAVDVSDPTAPVVIGALATDAADGVRVHDGTVWVCEGGTLSGLPTECLLSGVDATAVPARPASRLAVAPNPFRDGTTIRYDAPGSGPVALRLYDVQGRLVRRLVSGRSGAPGTAVTGWDGRDDAGAPVSPGLYFVRMESPDGVATAKVVRLR